MVKALPFLLLVAASATDVPGAALEEIRAAKVTIETKVAEARQNRDIILLNCFNEKLSMVKGMLKIAEETQPQLDSRDPDEVTHAAIKLEVTLQVVRKILTEAKEECVIRLDHHPAPARTEINVESAGAVPENDPLAKHFKIVYRIKRVEAGGESTIAVGLHHTLGASDSLTSVALSLGGEKILDEADRAGVVSPGSGRWLTQKQIKPGGYRLSIELRIDGQRPAGTLRLLATSAIDIDVQAGASVLVEITSTLDGHPEPGVLKR